MAWFYFFYSAFTTIFFGFFLIPAEYDASIESQQIGYVPEILRVSTISPKGILKPFT